MVVKSAKKNRKHKFSEADIPEDSKAVLAEGVGSGQLEYADIRNRLINVRSTKGSQARAGVLTSHTPPSESPSTSVKQDSNWYASECDVLIELRQYISDQMRSPESRRQSQQTFVANMKLDLKRGETLCEELDILAKSRQFNRCISKNEELEDWCFRVKRNLHNENNQPNNKRKSPSPPPEQYHPPGSPSRKSPVPFAARQLSFSPSSRPATVDLGNILTNLAPYVSSSSEAPMSSSSSTSMNSREDSTLSFSSSFRSNDHSRTRAVGT